MRIRAALAVPALLLALSACGGKAGEAAQQSSAAASASVTPDKQAAGLKFAQCMREHGVDMKDPEPGGGIRIMSRGDNEQTVKKAQEACQQYLKDAVGEKGKGIDPKEQDKILKFAQCMRQHGIDMPDPVNGRIELNVKPGTPEQKVKDAQQACKQWAPGGLVDQP